MLALITATQNSEKTLPDTLRSARDLERCTKHIFVDGCSSDSTLKQLDLYASTTRHTRILHQKTPGLYQALNQGIRSAIEDSAITHIAFLHSDDILLTDGYENYLDATFQNHADISYSDIEFHEPSGRRVRRWRAGSFSNFKLRTGWMPPHTSLVVNKRVYECSGLYNPAFGTAADYEWIVRVFTSPDYRFQYFPLITLSMLVGGASSASLRDRLKANAMDGRVWSHKSRLQSNVVRVCKPLRKLGQFFRPLAGRNFMYLPKQSSSKNC